MTEATEQAEPAGTGATMSTAVAGVGRTASWASDDPPELASPLSARRQRPPWWAYPAAPLLAGALAAGVLTRSRWGLAVAGAVLLILVLRHLRFILTLTALGLMAATAVYTVKHQALFHFPPGGWPLNFEPASELAWAAVVLLAADAIVEVARGVTTRGVEGSRSVRSRWTRGRGVPPEGAEGATAGAEAGTGGDEGGTVGPGD